MDTSGQLHLSEGHAGSPLVPRMRDWVGCRADVNKKLLPVLKMNQTFTVLQAAAYSPY
jgi:hypothetical protein